MLPNSPDSSPPRHLTPDNKRLFRVYVQYRLALSLLLITLFLSGLGENFLGTSKPSIFISSGYIYLFICATSMMCYCLKILRPQDNHILLLLVFDFIILAIMIHSSNSAIGGLGYLLLIPMAVGSTFLRGKSSVGLAAFASILIMSPNLIDIIEGYERSQAVFTAGITGTLLFITAISFRLLAKKIQSNEATIRQQTEFAEHVQGINQRVIETIEAGILVVDSDLNILFINRAAQDLLSRNQKFTQVHNIPPIHNILAEWAITQLLPDERMLSLGVNYNVKISFTDLSSNNIRSLMLYIEDKLDLTKEAQQLKLASLGRLTSSIAHEIRNPLGSISHASQLLDESENITQADQELLSMIQINSQRIDQTIKNILQFSRRKEAHTEVINLYPWLQKFIQQYKPHTQHNIELIDQQQSVLAYVDPNHLQQIMTNLVDNGFRHSQKEGSDNIITLRFGITPKNQLPYIDVIDEGDGIKEEEIDTIFEPFYTTKPTGAGLGLYLCKELCQANQADIIYMRKTDKHKSCFRLILSKTNTIDKDEK